MESGPQRVGLESILNTQWMCGHPCVLCFAVIGLTQYSAGRVVCWLLVAGLAARDV